MDSSNRLRVRAALRTTPQGQTVKIRGWLRTKRESKDCAFLEINDGSCLNNIQCVLPLEVAELAAILPSVHTGCALECEGQLLESPAKGQLLEIRLSGLKVIGACDPEDYPLQKKGHSFEFLRTIAHLRPRTNTFGAVFRLRHAASFAVHKFFNDRGFCYVHTPIITTSDCEGAGQMFRVSTLDLANVPRLDSGKPDFSQDFFAAEASLTVSGQLEGELLACALGDVYTFGPTFRAENSNTARHLAEFWMIEPEMAFCDLQGNMSLATDFVRYVIGYVLEHCSEDLKFFDERIEKGLIKSLELVHAAEFKQLTYTEAIKILENCGQKFEFPVKWGMDIQTEHERYLAEQYVKGPVFVTNYPKEIKSFYMRLDEGERTVSAMDLLVPRLGEIIGGSQREEREDVLRRRLAECGLDANQYWWYVDLRRFGTVPHAGFGLGFERLIMYLSGMANIRDVIPYPRTPGHAEF